MSNADPDKQYPSLFKAGQLVAEAIGMSLRRPRQLFGVRTAGNYLDAILNTNCMRGRVVRLRGQWWRGDHGPLLGFRADEDYAVALLPAGTRQYECVDPVTGSRTPVTESFAAELNPQAVQFFRPFPFRPMKAREVFRFGMQGNGVDILSLVLCGVISGIVGLAPPLLTGWMIDDIIPAADLDQHLYVFIGLACAAIGAGVFQLAQGLATLRIQGKSTLSLQAALWERLISMPANFFRGVSAGEMVQRGMSMESIQQMMAGQLVSLLMRAAFSSFSLFLLFYYSTKLAFWALILVAVVVGVSVLLYFQEMGMQRLAVQIRNKLSGLVLQLVTGIAKIRVAGGEKRAFANWAAQFAEMRTYQLKGRHYHNMQMSVMQAAPIVASILLFLAMASPEMQQALPLGSFIAFNTALGQFISAAIALSSAISPMLMVLPIYEQANVILNSVPEVGLEKREAPELTGRITVSSVVFGYDPKNLILRNVDFSVEPGQFVAIVGPSGSGKSTLLRLLLGFEKPHSGAIYYDGLSLGSLDIGSVRRQFGVVLQNGQLMQGTLFSNIVGASRATLEDAWQAVRLAGAENDVKAMPMQLQTVIPHGGSTLSGGQKQRIMIARALVGRPKILFFDEATSALDNRTQQEVQQSLDSLASTRVVIAHRLSTVRNADRIIVLKDGAVVESGTYDELMAKDGFFTDLAKRQVA